MRELENVLERLIARFPGVAVGAADVHEALGSDITPCTDLVCDAPVAGGEIARAVRAANGNVAAAARSLGVPRTTLRRRLAHLGAQAGRV